MGKKRRPTPNKKCNRKSRKWHEGSGQGETETITTTSTLPSILRGWNKL